MDSLPYQMGRSQASGRRHGDPSATTSKIHFGMLDTEPDLDYVIIRDGSGNEIQRVDGAFYSGLWSAEVPGRIVRVQLTSDYSFAAWGFCVD